MKKFFAVAALLVAFSVYGQDEKGLARVNKRQGIEIYIMSEPVRAYDVTGNVTKDDISSVVGALFGDKDERTLNEMIDTLIKNANRKMKKGKLTFDAIITEDGKTGTLIKFKDQSKP